MHDLLGFMPFSVKLKVLDECSPYSCLPVTSQTDKFIET
jgi:hypothetical protein